MRWLNQDIEYILKSGVTQDGIEIIKEENKITEFDVVLIDGSEFTGRAELEHIYGAKIIMLDDINTFKNYENHQILIRDSNYSLVTENKRISNGYAVFKRNESFKDKGYSRLQPSEELPIHFFTIVLNGEPFIRYHIEVFKQLPFSWHWHIVEGVAQLDHDTGWSVAEGVGVIDQMHNQGRSVDGTSQYLDHLAAVYPENITIYRKQEGMFWDGKHEMVNEPLITSIREQCLLWQIDVDELWTVEQISKGRKAFIENPEKTAAFYWCWYFVGENLVISTRSCYAKNPQQDCLRTWRFKLGCVWEAHESPVLVMRLPDGKWVNTAEINPFTPAETEREGLVFQHFAYVTLEQLKFKEQYYGYQNATNQWKSLQSKTKFPIYLREYFPWVGDQTMVDYAQSLGVIPLIQKDITGNQWKFILPDIPQPGQLEKRSPTIIIDGVFFQLYNTDIARVWHFVLAEWAKTEFADYIILLDRANNAKIAGIRCRAVPPYDYNDTKADKEMLQTICDQEGADIFISTYYTTPISTPSVFMAYDMIPEVLGADCRIPMWQEKHHAIRHASSYICISDNTALDLLRLFPELRSNPVRVAHCGVAPIFTPATATDIIRFKHKYGITKPYFLLVGSGGNYKNTILFFRAFSQLETKQGFELICTGSRITLGEEYRQYATGSVVHSLVLNDEELKVAYSGAVALVYPSIYEGFGIPVAEALACGCPVITCPNASIPEVAGKAAIYVNDNDIDALTDALCDIQKPKVRHALTILGWKQVQKFSWKTMADIISSALLRTTLEHLNLREMNFIVFPDWLQSEETVRIELTEVIKKLIDHPASSKITLLIDNSNVVDKEADLLLSSIAMSLFLENDLEREKSPEVVLVGKLHELQWSELISQLKGWIRLVHESKKTTSLWQLERIPTIDIDNIRIN